MALDKGLLDNFYTLVVFVCAPDASLYQVFVCVSPFRFFVCSRSGSWFVMLENSMFVQVSSRAAREEVVWFPPGEGCTII
jgi:hypothetical protein